MTRTLGLALVLLASLVLGCNRRGRAGPLAPTIPRSLTRFAQFAQRDLDCTHVDQVLFVLPNVVQARGCGQRQEYLVLPGRTPSPVGRVETLAEREMQCNAGNLTVESPAPAVRAVSGCERRARYDLGCEHGICTWTMTAHAGRWAGLLPTASDVPAQFDVAWELPPEVTTAPVSSAPTEIDLASVPLPPPPDAVIPPPP